MPGLASLVQDISG